MSNDPLDYKPLNREAYVMVKPDELARLHDENEQLKELWRQFIAAESRGESQRAVDVIEQAAVLLAGMKPEEDSDATK